MSKNKNLILQRPKTACCMRENRRWVWRWEEEKRESRRVFLNETKMYSCIVDRRLYFGKILNSKTETQMGISQKMNRNVLVQPGLEQNFWVKETCAGITWEYKAEIPREKCGFPSLNMNGKTRGFLSPFLRTHEFRNSLLKHDHNNVRPKAPCKMPVYSAGGTKMQL